MKTRRKVEVEQGSSSWHSMRAKRIGASVSPAIMGDSPYDTPYSAWRKIVFPKESSGNGGFTNFAMDRGNRWESAVRAKYELMYDHPMPATVFIHAEYDWLMASLDGFNEEKNLILEIKCCGKEVMDAAKSGIVHSKYVWQLEHQMLVAQADMVHFYCASVKSVSGREQIIDTALVEYKSDPDRRQRLIKALHKFWDCVTSKTPPPLTAKDVLVIDDPIAKEKFSLVHQLVKAHDQAEFVLDLAQKELDRIDKELLEAKKQITPYCSQHPKVICEGVGLKVIEKIFKNGKIEHDLKLVS